LLRSVIGGDRASVAAVVGTTLSLCCRPFRTRLESALKGELDVVLAHELRSVLQFYRVTLAPFVGAEGSFPELSNEFQVAFRNLFDSLVAAAAAEARNQTTVHPDLGPPSVLHRTAAHVGRIGETLETLLLPDEERAVSALLDPLMMPLVEMCERMASHLSVELGSVFLINCCVLLRDVIAPFPAAETLFQMLTDRIDAAVTAVGEAEAQTLLTRAQLQGNLEDLRAMDSKTLRENVKSLEQVVGETGLVLGTSTKVQDSRTREKVRDVVVARVLNTYEVIYQLVHVHDASNNFPDQMMQYTPSQFKLLLLN
jgi:hypothetical protein